MNNDNQANDNIANFSYPSVASTNGDNPGNSNTQPPQTPPAAPPTPSPTEPQGDDPNAPVSKPEDLETQLSNLSGLGTPSVPPPANGNDAKVEKVTSTPPPPAGSPNPREKDDNQEVSAPPTLGEGDVSVDNDKNSPLKKLASRLSKVKDELVEPTVSLSEDGVNLSGNNPVESSTPPPMGPGQTVAPAEAELAKQKKEEADKAEISKMKSDLNDLREIEKEKDNSKDVSMDSPNTSDPDKKISESTSDSAKEMKVETDKKLSEQGKPPVTTTSDMATSAPEPKSPSAPKPSSADTPKASVAQSTPTPKVSDAQMVSTQKPSDSQPTPTQKPSDAKIAPAPKAGETQTTPTPKAGQSQTAPAPKTSDSKTTDAQKTQPQSPKDDSTQIDQKKATPPQTAPTQTASPSQAKPDPMGLNQPLQPVVQMDPDSQDVGGSEMRAPDVDPESVEDSQKFKEIAKQEIESTPPAQQSTTPKAAPTLPFDPVVANPTVQKVTEDLAPEVADKMVAKPTIATTPPPKKNGEAPAIKHSRYPYTIEQLLDLVVERDASDLHITVGYPAMIRVDGAMISVIDEPVTIEQAPDLVLPVLPEQKKELLDVNREVDLAYPHRADARFRINAYYQQQSLAAAFRLIPNKIRSIDELNLPQVYHKLTKLKQGLVLVTGPTGSGKSTTLAAIIQEINENRPDHIITIEDPVEYVFPKARAMVDQRELHEDTHSWEIALRSALRQDPDVILVGEMRDFDTISSAITLAETGHLVFATLHTNSAAQTLDRIVDVFPEHQQAQVRSQLSNTIEAVVAQRLIPLQRGGRSAVSEIMIATPAIRNLIREAKTHQIDNVIRTSADIGMISLEHTLVRLVRENAITMERAQEYAVHPEEIVRLLKS